MITTLVLAAATLTPGTWKMYPTPAFEPNAFCDKFAELTLDNGAYTKEFAVLEDALGGVCEIYVSPNPRFSRLVLENTDCGSQVWAGEMTEGGDRFDVRITDHRHRLCDDVVPALVILEKTELSSGAKSTLYSSNQ